MIHVYELSKLDVAQRTRLLRRAEIEIDDLLEYVRPIVRAVRERGDEALIEFMTRFDRVQLTPDRLRVSRDEIEHAYQWHHPANGTQQGLHQTIDKGAHRMIRIHEI